MVFVEDKKILLFEDSAEEVVLAMNEIKKRGFKNIEHISNLFDFNQKYGSRVSELVKPDYIISDLFFPIGEETNELSCFKEEILYFYEEYKNNFFNLKANKEGPVYLAVDTVSELMGISHEEYLFKIFPMMEKNEKILHLTRSAYYGIHDYSRVEKFEKVMERVKSGEMFPSGVFIGDYAREQNIPLVYVTSTNHHDLAFEPLRVKLGFPYVDRLIDGLKKDWNSGLEILLD